MSEHRSSRRSTAPAQSGSAAGSTTPAEPVDGAPDGPARTRDRQATAGRILAAVGDVLARDGFEGIGINAIAKQAGVDKVLIYRYFGGLPELLTEWGRSGRFWPTVDEMLGDDPAGLLALPVAERYARFFDRFIDALRARPLTLEVLAAEILVRNELTAILEAEREAWGDEVARALGGDAEMARPEVQGITLLLVAGIQYLLVRSRKTRIFSGLDLQTDEAWVLLKASIRTMARDLLATDRPER